MLKDPLVVIVLVVLGIVMAIVGNMFMGDAEGQNAGNPHGLRTFEPTRIEWMAMELNSRNPMLSAVGDGAVYVAYSPDPPNGIMVTVHYMEGADPAAVREYRHIARNKVRIAAERYGWEDWLNVSDSREVIEGSEG